ncbi:MAG: hypothetical protein V1816_10865 [Pseudomonadota bacterium]
MPSPDDGNRAEPKPPLKQEAELEELLARLKLHLARLALPGEDDLEPGPRISPQKLNALCRVVAVLSPPAAVALRRLDQDEAETRELSVEERMKKVMELLKGAGFAPQKVD